MQRFRCKDCRKEQQCSYVYNAYSIEIDKDLTQLLKEGVGIRSSARILGISISTVINRIKRISLRIKNHTIHSLHSIYEIDELWTFVGNKSNDVWITYSIDRYSKAVINYVIGPRTRSNLQLVTDPTLAMKPK